MFTMVYLIVIQYICRQWWMPDTGGANIPALNDLISPLNMAFRSESCDRLCSYMQYLLIFPSLLWHCWLGNRKSIQPVKTLVLVCWWWQFDWSFTHQLQLSLPPSSLLQ